MMVDKVKMTRRVAFSSGHRYWREDLSEEENRRLFGKWASRFNHGHNYALWVTVEGKVDASTGMVVNIKDIDRALQEQIVEKFDQKSLNDEVEILRGRPTTVEGIMQAIAGRLELPPEVDLIHIKLEETPLLYGELNLLNKSVSITRIYEFAASHRLHSDMLPPETNVALYGKCNNLAGHGHNYLLEVTITGEPDPKTGMSVDIEALDRAVEDTVVDRYDHKNLNVDVPEFAGKITTSEVVAQEIFSRLEGAVPGKLRRVRLHETARNIFEIEAA